MQQSWLRRTDRCIKICHRFIVNITAQLGGKKTGDSTYQYKNQSYSFGDQQFVGTKIVVQSQLKIDKEPPSHCLLTLSGKRSTENDRVNCSVFPIYLDQDIRTVSIVMMLIIQMQVARKWKKKHIRVLYERDCTFAQSIIQLSSYLDLQNFYSLLFHLFCWVISPMHSSLFYGLYT